MTKQAPRSASSSSNGLSARDVLYVLFRHKWKIAFFSLVGLAAAVAFFLVKSDEYESQAKLLVRYVVERSAVDSVNSEVNTSNGRQSAGVINSEIQILTSWDLAAKVAENVGPDAILPKDPNPSVPAAANLIVAGLTAVADQGSNVITVSYRHPVPDVSRTVLSELVRVYFDKHLEVHRSMGAFDFVSQQTDQLRSRLRQTEEELRKVKNDAGIVSVDGSLQALNDRIAATHQSLLAAEAFVAEQQARVNQLGDAPQNASTPTEALATPDGAMAVRYQALMARLTALREEQYRLLERYTEGSAEVGRNRAAVDQLERQRRDMEAAYPALAGTAVTGPASLLRLDPMAERANLAAAEARVQALRKQLQELNEQTTRISESAALIRQLERKKTLEEENFRYFESSLEKARVDEALDPSKIPNISIVQAPSPAFRVFGEANKVILGLAGGGVALGMALAFLIELVLDQRVRRPYELETRLGVPQLMAIPFFGSNPRALARSQNPSGKGGGSTVSQWTAPVLGEYAEAVRDRLIHLFEIEKRTHKPKMIGVAGCGKGAGATTLACDLAASLSETGDGKVLLVDVNSPKGAAHPFLGGRPARTVAETLTPGASREGQQASENLYLATATSPDEQSARLVSKTLSGLIPKFHSSDFDYIIFDMPPVGQTSPTLTLAGFMDKMLYVVEAGKTDRDVVRRGFDSLVAAKADVLAVLNKVRNSVPKWIESHAI